MTQASLDGSALRGKAGYFNMSALFVLVSVYVLQFAPYDTMQCRVVVKIALTEAKVKTKSRL